MTPYSASTLERLASELEAADKEMTPGPWTVDTVEYKSASGVDPVVCGIYGADRTDDFGMGPEVVRQRVVETDSGVYEPLWPDARGIAHLRNSAPEVAAALRSAVAEVERLRALVVEASLPFGLRRLYEHVFNDAGVSEADETRIIADIRERTAKEKSK